MHLGILHSLFWGIPASPSPWPNISGQIMTERPIVAKFPSQNHIQLKKKHIAASWLKITFQFTMWKHMPGCPQLTSFFMRVERDWISLRWHKPQAAQKAWNLLPRRDHALEFREYHELYRPVATKSVPVYWKVVGNRATCMHLLLEIRTQVVPIKWCSIW